MIDARGSGAIRSIESAATWNWGLIKRPDEPIEVLGTQPLDPDAGSLM